MKNNLRLINSVKPVVFGNPEDARISDLQNRLGLSMDLLKLADADKDEVASRYEIINWLLENRSLMSYQFFRSKFTGLQYGNSADTTMPSDSNQFLLYAQNLEQKSTSFWKAVKAFKAVDQSLYQTPQKIDDLSNVINREGEVKYLEEKELAGKILSEVRQIITVSGILKYYWGGQSSTPRLERDMACYGTWEFHPELDPKLNPSRGYTERFLKASWIGKPLAKLIAFTSLQLKKELAQIKITPDCILDDITTYLCKLFEDHEKFLFLTDCYFTIGYVFDEKGLRISFLDWKVRRDLIPRAHLKVASEYGIAKRGYRASSISRKIHKQLQKKELKYLHSEIGAWFLKNRKPIVIDGTETHRVFCKLRFANVYSKYQSEIKELKNWQNSIAETFNDLHTFHALARAVRRVKIAYCFPKIVDEQSLELQNFYPVRIKPKKGRKIKPFSYLDVNGKIANYTGRNGSGKSTIMLSALDAQILAQCGLPIFTHSAQLCLRTHILMSFLDRDSEESTFKSKAFKDMEIVRIIREVRESNPELLPSILVINDELGSATDQGDVVRVYKPYVKWIHDQGVSAIIATQIPEIGEYINSAESGFIGENFMIDKDYQIREGIGSGEPYEVAKEMGFFDILD